MLNWDLEIKDSSHDPQSYIWMGQGGDGMAVVARKEHGYELTAWWTGHKGKRPLTEQPPPVFPTLEEAQQEANRLIFERKNAWTHLLEDL